MAKEEHPLKNGDGILFPSELKSNWQNKYINKFLDSHAGYMKITKMSYKKEHGIYHLTCYLVSGARQVFTGKTHFENYYNMMNTAHKNIQRRKSKIKTINYNQGELI